MKKTIYICLLVLLLASNSYSQGWKAKVGFGSSYYTGNVEKVDLRGEGNISHTDSTFEFSSFVKATYGEMETIKNNQEFQAGIQADYKPYAKLSPFLLFTAYNNEFKDIALRLSGITGLKYTFYKTEKSNYSISTALQYDAEQYKSDIEDKEILRLSIRPKLKQQIAKQ